MTKFKHVFENVDIKEVKKITSKKNNTYLLLVSDEQTFYYPDPDSDIETSTLLGVHSLTCEVTISKYSDIKVIKVN